MNEAFEREVTRINANLKRSQHALEVVTAVEPFAEKLEAAGLELTGIYVNVYTDQVDFTFDSQSVSTFNDGTVTALLEARLEATGGDPGSVRADDAPEERLRSFSWDVTFIPDFSIEPSAFPLGILLHFVQRVYLNKDGLCQIVVEREEEVTTEKWVRVTEKRPVLRFLCPEE